MSSRARLSIPTALLTELMAIARGELPNECCGFLGGQRRGEVYHIEQLAAMVNALASPTRFESEPRSLFAAKRRIEQSGHEILGIYHSHPTSAPIPSRFDLADHHWGESVACVIVGFWPQLSVRAWWWSPVGFEESAIVSE